MRMTDIVRSGWDDNGQLGHGCEGDSSKARVIQGLASVCSVSAGQLFSAGAYIFPILVHLFALPFFVGQHNFSKGSLFVCWLCAV